MRAVNESYEGESMKLYVAKCETYDPDNEYDCSCPPRTEILGIFSTQKLAEEAFTRKEQMQGEHGGWLCEHMCFRGTHEVVEYELDAWKKGGDMLFTQSLGRGGEVTREWRSKSSEIFSNKKLR